MAYIIENANILKDKKLSAQSFLVNKDRITSTRPSFGHERFMKMNLEFFIMTPTFVLLNSTFPINLSFQEKKDVVVNQFLMRGCTTLLTYINVNFEDQLSGKMKDMKNALISSPIDFLVGIKIPVRLITPSFIRQCKKEKVPAIFIELDSTNEEELRNVPWGWIKEALFPFNCPFIPIISSLDKKDFKTVVSKWKGIMESEKISALFEGIEENQPLSVPVLNKLGLYPKKASLMNGTELSYNLYYKSREIMNLDEQRLFHYHGNSLVVTVHKGKIIRSGHEVVYKPGFGEYVEVKTPSFFSL